jgi:hypothetical protein
LGAQSAQQQVFLEINETTLIGGQATKGNPVCTKTLVPVTTVSFPVIVLLVNSSFNFAEGAHSSAFSVAEHYSLRMSYCRFYSNAQRACFFLGPAGRPDTFHCIDFFNNSVNTENPDSSAYAHIVVKCNCEWDDCHFAQMTDNVDFVGRYDMEYTVIFRACVFDIPSFTVSGVALYTPDCTFSNTTEMVWDEDICGTWTYPTLANGDSCPVRPQTRSPSPTRSSAFEPSDGFEPSVKPKDSRSLLDSVPLKSTRAFHLSNAIEVSAAPTMSKEQTGSAGVRQSSGFEITVEIAESSGLPGSQFGETMPPEASIAFTASAEYTATNSMRRSTNLPVSELSASAGIRASANQAATKGAAASVEFTESRNFNITQAAEQSADKSRGFNRSPHFGSGPMASSDQFTSSATSDPESPIHSTNLFTAREARQKPGGPGDSGSNIWVILGSVLGAIILVAVILALLYIRHRLVAQSEGEEADVEPPMPTEEQVTFQEAFQADEFYNPVGGSENDNSGDFANQSDEAAAL